MKLLLKILCYIPVVGVLGFFFWCGLRAFRGLIDTLDREAEQRRKARKI